MNQYHVYGIGNALVDMEYAVSGEDLREMRIDKGVMTLVDADHQGEIMVYLADNFAKRSAGGSAANSVIAVSQFGGHGFYSCKVADDELGHFYVHDLRENGVDTNAHNYCEPGHTGRCLVMVSGDADRTMATHLGITGGFARHELVEDALTASDYLYVEGYLVTSATARDAAVHAREVARQAGVKTSLSLSDPNMVTHFKDGLLEMIGPGVDLVFANEAEAKGMADTDDLQEAIEYMKTLAKEFAITLGPGGALLWDGQVLIEIPPHPVKAVDTVGAGDMFAGAYLYGITQGWDRRRAGNLASAASAKLVTAYGPRLDAGQAQSVLQAFE